MYIFSFTIIDIAVMCLTLATLGKSKIAAGRKYVTERKNAIVVTTHTVVELSLNCRSSIVPGDRIQAVFGRMGHAQEVALSKTDKCSNWCL